MELIVCQTGVKRHAPELERTLADGGHRLGSVECFDRCETCERFLIVRVDGATMRFDSEQALLDTLAALSAE